MKRRFLCAIVLFALVAAILPAPVQATSDYTANQIEKQITTTYNAAKNHAGLSSFNGLCATLVGWQMYLLGIDAEMICRDGKDEFDLYRYMGITTGGYTIKTYPSPSYTLRSALYEITQNGKVDAYNIMVGFERTDTELGKRFGHAVLIHAIIGGEVYFTECYSTSLDGKYWAEGSAIHCSIDTFCDSYNRWTVFDGIAYFGVRNYADLCESYPASMYAMVTQTTSVYTEPSDIHAQPTVKSGSYILAGEIVAVDTLLKTPGGKFWYGLADGTYVPAEMLAYAAARYDDIVIKNLQVPTALRQGSGHLFQGILSSKSCQLDSVEVSVYAHDESYTEPIMSGTLQSGSHSINLNNWKLDRNFMFRSLSAGKYRVQIDVVATTYVLKNGAPFAKQELVTLWNSNMQIVADWGAYATVSFDGNGGAVSLNQDVLAVGNSIEILPTASSSKGQFAFWSFDKEGTQPVTSQTPIETSVTLYAQWKDGTCALSGWHHTENGWVYYENGAVKNGWVSFAGLTLYQMSDGSRAAEWKYIDNTWYYFTSNGILSSKTQGEQKLELLSNFIPASSMPMEQTLPALPSRVPSTLSILLWIFCSLLALGAIGAGVIYLLLKKQPLSAWLNIPKHKNGALP